MAAELVATPAGEPSVPAPDQAGVAPSRPLSDTETLLWMAEADPVLRSSYLAIVVLDRPPDAAVLTRRLAAAATQVERLRQRVATPASWLGASLWVEDPGFDLDSHIRRTALQPPGDDRQLLDLAARELEDPFDGAHPLWRFTIVEGLQGGRGGLLAKFHHAVADGVGALRLAAAFIDLERHPAEPPRPASGPDTRPPIDPPRSVPGGAGRLDALGGQAARALRVPAGLGRAAWSGLVGSVTNPLGVPRQAGDAMASLSATLRQLVVTDGARSPLWSGRRSVARHVEVFSLDLAAVREAAGVLGGTVNDLFVAGVAGGAASYHRRHGDAVDELRASIPVSTRTDDTVTGNSFLPVRILLPVGLEDAKARFAAVHDLLTVMKSQPRSSLVDAVTGLAASLPPALVARLARTQVATVDFAASNVRGAPFDLFVGGARVLANYPIGPTGGTAFNATVLSGGAHLDVGITIDTAAIPDPAVLRDCLADSMAALIAAGS